MSLKHTKYLQLSATCSAVSRSQAFTAISLLLSNCKHPTTTAVTHSEIILPALFMPVKDE